MVSCHCGRRASFNYENELKVKFCGTHKENGMVYIKHQKCEFEGCKTRASFNFEGQTKA